MVVLVYSCISFGVVLSVKSVYIWREKDLRLLVVKLRFLRLEYRLFLWHVRHVFGRDGILVFHTCHSPAISHVYAIENENTRWDAFRAFRLMSWSNVIMCLMGILKGRWWFTLEGGCRA